MSAKGVYFPGLNALRFFAAMAVAVSHVELMKQYHGYPSAYDDLALYELGRLSVTLFFVLSGYLITYLLLAEKREPRGISVAKFYVRRILRIWPLYFLVVLLSFLLFPHIPAMHVPVLTGAIGQHFSRTFPMFLLFLPQLALSIYTPVPFAEPAWSIGVEEQFYLLWPLLMKKVKNVLALMVVVIVVMIGARYFALEMAKANRADAAALQTWNQVINYFYFTRIECMAIGGVFAWIVFEKKRAMLAFFHHPAVQFLTYAATIYALLTDAGKPIFNYGGYAVLFAILILNVSTNPRSLLRLGTPRLEFLGNISFSIYMLHEVAIQLTMFAATRVSATRFATGPSNAALYGVSLLLTIALACATYLWFERPFLRLKSRFAIVPSGADAREGASGLAPA